MKHRSLHLPAVLPATVLPAAVRLTAVLLTAVLLLVGCSAANDGKAESYPGGDMNTSVGAPGAPGAADKNESLHPDGTVGEFDRKIIRTVIMSCESKTFDDAISMIMATLAAHDGYVEISSSSGGGGARSVALPHTAREAHYTLRVPAERLDAFLEALRTDGNLHITDQSMSSSEITGAYYDTKTRIETLRTEKDALTAMLAGFTDYSDISAMLEVQRRLYDVIEELETWQTKLNLYDSQVALSTVNLSLQEVIEYTAAEEPTFGERIGDAFMESWTNFGQGCQDLAVWFVEYFPTLLILAVVAALVIIIIVRRHRKKKAQKGE